MLPTITLAAIVLDRSQQRSLQQKATINDLSLQSVYIAARNNHSLPTILIVTSNKLNTIAAVYCSILLLPSSATAVYIAASSSAYCSHTLAATYATCSHEVAPQPQPTLLLPSSSFAIAAAFQLRSLGYHLPINISHLKNHSLDDVAASTLHHHRRTAADITAAIFFLHRCCYPWLSSST
ncbi:hypothetical protein GW17_00051386 [Ensete ventricosum]|nr:hypothetical protein GW17_00051386 [Ensete ventricosum]